MARQIRPLAKNPNKHTQRGLRELEKSVREDGWVAPITVAADGESLDGAARLEVAADVMDGIEPLVVEHDGTRPVVMVRTDIPDATTAQARRIAYRANRVAELDLDWDADVLAADVEAGLSFEGLWEGLELLALENVANALLDDSGDANSAGGLRPWDAMKNAKGRTVGVKIGDIETVIPTELADRIQQFLEAKHAEGLDVRQLMIEILTAGMDATERCGA